MLPVKLSRGLRQGFITTLCLFSINSFARDAFELMGVSTPAGEKQAYMAQEGDINLPVTVVNGAQQGPVLLLAAGTHGDEFPAMFALQKLAKELENLSAVSISLLICIRAAQIKNSSIMCTLLLSVIKSWTS